MKTIWKFVFPIQDDISLSMPTDISTQVPLTVNGQPFGCRGWSAKETP